MKNDRLLAMAGQALYGPRWQAELARNLHVSQRTVQRWAKGTHTVSDENRVEIRGLLQEQMRVISDIIDAVDAIDGAERVRS